MSAPGSLLPAAANLAWAAANLPAYVAFRDALHDPRRVQDQLLGRYVQHNAGTDFGRRHDFAKMLSADDFRRRVPLANHDSLAEDIDRVAAGEVNVLTSQRVERLATSSGSTRARKLIPYTPQLQREFNRAIGAWIVDLFRRDPSLLGGCAYWSISPVVPQDSKACANAPPIGFEEDSAYLGGTSKRLVDAVMAVPADVRHVTDIDAFRYATLRHLLGRRDLRLISVWHPTFLELLLDAARPKWERLIDDIARRDPRRAAQLPASAPGDWRAVWPGLRLISCWADAHALGPSQSLQRRFPGVALQPKGLLATEAFVTIPFAGRWPLAIRSHFFEFLADDGRSMLAHELRRGAEYRVVVTTGGGLWRYQLGDRVRVDGFLGRTPSLRFIGRDDLVADRFGEKLSEGFVGNVLRSVLGDHAIGTDFAMLAMDDSGNAAYYTLFTTATASSAVAADLDRALRRSPHYAYCRDLGQLAPVRIFRIEGNASDAYAATLQAAGRRIGDVKPTALSSRTDWARHFQGRYVPTGSA